MPKKGFPLSSHSSACIKSALSSTKIIETDLNWLKLTYSVPMYWIHLLSNFDHFRDDYRDITEYTKIKPWTPIVWVNFKLNVHLEYLDSCFNKEKLFKQYERNFEITCPAVSIIFCCNFLSYISIQRVFGRERDKSGFHKFMPIS